MDIKQLIKNYETYSSKYDEELIVEQLKRAGFFALIGDNIYYQRRLLEIGGIVSLASAQLNIEDLCAFGTRIFLSSIKKCHKKHPDWNVLDTLKTGLLILDKGLTWSIKTFEEKYQEVTESLHDYLFYDVDKIELQSLLLDNEVWDL